MNPFPLGLALVALTGSAVAAGEMSRVLILSGANNHDWRKTTPAIKSALEETGRFKVDVEDNVIGMPPDAFAPYAVILSNFNTFGKDATKDTQWPEATRRAFLDHIAGGRGLVIVHAGSSVFYDWPEFQSLACGTWRGGTRHGRIHVGRVTFTDAASPITAGLEPFWIRDEFWEDIDAAPGAKVLATVVPDPAHGGSGKAENILAQTESGGGRGFALFLGHDTTTMENTAWRTLLQRGTEWAATGKVTIPPAKDWPASPEAAEAAGLTWSRTATSLALRNDGRTVWQAVFDPARPKAYVHPLATVDGEVLTAMEPADHPWHRGLWWSWKLINGINYWEEDRSTGKSQGLTELVRADVKPGDDFSANIELRFRYRPPGQEVVMTETRRLVVLPPDAAGTYQIDWTGEFTAGAAPVKLDRTPPPGQGGPAYGGYAGLSLRLPHGLTGWVFRTSEGRDGAAAGHGKPARWVDLSGPAAGIAIFDHPANPRHPQPWYLSDKPELVFFGPAPLFDQALEIAPHATLKLRHRIVIHSKSVTETRLEALWRDFAATKAP